MRRSSIYLKIQIGNFPIDPAKNKTGETTKVKERRIAWSTVDAQKS